MKTSEGNITVTMELSACHLAYCSQAANKKVTKNSKFLAFEARKKIKSVGASSDLQLWWVWIMATESSSSEWGHCMNNVIILAMGESQRFLLSF